VEWVEIGQFPDVPEAIEQVLRMEVAPEKLPSSIACGGQLEPIVEWEVIVEDVISDRELEELFKYRRKGHRN